MKSRPGEKTETERRAELEALERAFDPHGSERETLERAFDPMQVRFQLRGGDLMKADAERKASYRAELAMVLKQATAIARVQETSPSDEDLTDTALYVVRDGCDFVVNSPSLQRLQLQIPGLEASEVDELTVMLRRARWITRQLDGHLLELLADFIVESQRDFFENGPRSLRPMTLKEAADAVGVSESTASRATQGRHLQTPQGILTYKYFFNSAIRRDGAPSMASEAVKQVMARVIAEEDKSAPLSDVAIAKVLRASEKIEIATRTVTKYRRAMGIPNFAERVPPEYSEQGNRVHGRSER